MQYKNHLPIFEKLGLFFIVLLVFDYGNHANADHVPDWIKKISLWFGQELISEMEFLNAIEYLFEKKIIVLDPSDMEQNGIEILPSDDADKLQVKGIEQLRLGDEEDALIYFDKALEKRPDDVKILINKGVAKANLGDLDNAKILFDSAIAISESQKRVDYRAVFNSGLAISIYGNQNDALEYFDRILDNKNLVDNDLLYATLVNKGAILYEHEKYEESIIYLDEAMKIYPNRSGALVNKANSLQELGLYDEALSLFEKAYTISRDITFKPSFIIITG